MHRLPTTLCVPWTLLLYDTVPYACRALETDWRLTRAKTRLRMGPWSRQSRLSRLASFHLQIRCSRALARRYRMIQNRAHVSRQYVDACAALQRGSGWLTLRMLGRQWMLCVCMSGASLLESAARCVTRRHIACPLGCFHSRLKMFDITFPDTTAPCVPSSDLPLRRTSECGSQQ